jgi:uroporphyrinogen-III decarboxylase
MTDRERILAAIRGDFPDRVPFVPRLDFWFRARRYTNTLPPAMRGLNLMEIADRLGVGCYATIPDYTVETDEMADIGLGIMRLPVLTYKVTVEGVNRRVLSLGREIVVEYDTPFGTVRTAMGYTEEMLEAGCSSPNYTEHPIRNPQDFAAVGYIFEHLKVEPQTEGYEAARKAIGDRGIVVATTSGRACPMQQIMMDLMTVEQFSYAQQDCPAELERLAEHMEPYYQSLKSCAADSPAEVIMLGGNYDDSLTYPGFFKKYILGPLRDYADLLHQKGKFLMTHTDGENRLLLPLYLEAGFDIADSLCPFPMTRCTLGEIRAAFADRITIWGGIPCVLLCPGSASWEEFRRYVDELLQRYGHESHFILGVSDMVSADAEWSRVEYISEKVAALK